MKEYSKYIGAVYVFFLFILVVLGSFFITRLPQFTQERLQIDTLVFPKDTAGIKAELQMVKGTVSPPVDIFKLSIPTPQLVEKGKGIYSINCVSCHGDQGKGDGTAGALLNPKPRNFTSPDGWKNGPKLSQMYKTLQEGVPNSSMPSFAQLPPEDRISLIHFIHETFVKNFPKNTDEELKELDKTYSLLAGAKLPNQIPVSMAMEKVLAEKGPFDKKVDSIVAIVKNNKADSGAVILKNISSNLSKSVTVLALDSVWMNNDKALAGLLMSNPVSNGFKARAYALTPRELAILHPYLRNLFTAIK